MKLFRNRFFLICLSVALMFTAVMTTFSIMGYHGLVSDAVGTVTTPFRLVGSVFVKAARGFDKYFGNNRRLRERNEALEEENELLRLRIAEAEQKELENEHLRVYLGMKAQNPELELTNATVIGRESSGTSVVYVFNRGTAHGISKDMPVITNLGLVGLVKETGLTWCKVVTVLEPNNAVGCYLPEERGRGILEGDYTGQTKGLCRLTNITPTDAVIKEGDIIRTSGGLGSLYPPDIVVGAVETSEDSSIAWVRPFVDFDNLENAMIVTGYAKQSQKSE